MLVLELPPIVLNQKGVFFVGVLRHGCMCCWMGTARQII